MSFCAGGLVEIHTVAVLDSVSHTSTYTDKHPVVQKRSDRSAQDVNKNACFAAAAGQVAVPSSAPAMLAFCNRCLPHDSEFRCALGTSMAENIPFLHAIATGVVGSVVGHGGSVESALPSVMVAYALSAVVTGVAFYLLGSLQLGQVSRAKQTKKKCRMSGIYPVYNLWAVCYFDMKCFLKWFQKATQRWRH